MAVVEGAGEEGGIELRGFLYCVTHAVCVSRVCAVEVEVPWPLHGVVVLSPYCHTFHASCFLFSSFCAWSRAALCPVWCPGLCCVLLVEGIPMRTQHAEQEEQGGGGRENHRKHTPHSVAAVVPTSVLGVACVLMCTRQCAQNFERTGERIFTKEFRAENKGCRLFVGNLDPHFSECVSFGSPS